MGNVALILRIMPESPDVDLEKLKTQIRAKIPEVQDVRKNQSDSVSKH
jgi:elongation factor 1-beta